MKNVLILKNDEEKHENKYQYECMCTVTWHMPFLMKILYLNEKLCIYVCVCALCRV